MTTYQSTRPSPAPKMRAVLLLAAVVVAAFPGPSAARQQQRSQVTIPTPSDSLYEVRLTDGSVLIAQITEVRGETVVFTTSGGSRVEVGRTQIRSIRPARGSVVEGEYWPEDPSETRLFFTATGRSLPAGQAYVGTYLVVLPFVAFGVTDRFTVAAGAPVLFGEFEPFYVAPKLQIARSPSAELSVGTLAFFFADEVVGILYGVGTFGNRNHAATLGVGFGYAGDDFSSQPVAMIGGETRVSRRVKLMTENYFLPGETGVVLSGGLRLVGDRLSTDIGMAAGGGDGEFGCCVPMLNFSYGFGGNR